jgi:hypothetical protein
LDFTIGVRIFNAHTQYTPTGLGGREGRSEINYVYSQDSQWPWVGRVSDSGSHAPSASRLVVQPATLASDHIGHVSSKNVDPVGAGVGVGHIADVEVARIGLNFVEHSDTFLGSVKAASCLRPHRGAHQIPRQGAPPLPLVELLHCNSVVCQRDIDQIVPLPSGGLTGYREAVARSAIDGTARRGSNGASSDSGSPAGSW